MLKLQQPVLVTGAAGFIGRRLVTRLMERGDQVRVLARSRSIAPQTWHRTPEIVFGDLCRADSLRPAVDKIGTIFHLAAKVGDWGSRGDFWTANVVGTQNLLDLCRGTNTRVVMTSSIAVYGDHLATKICDEGVGFGRAIGHYSRSKQAQERAALEYFEKDGLPITILRPGNVWGPGSGPWVTAALQQLRRRLPILIEFGVQNAGLCHVDNLIEGLLAAAEDSQSIGEIYNMTDGSDVTWARYFSDLARVGGAPLPKRTAFRTAQVSAFLCEGLWKGLFLPGRPPVTREALLLVGSNLQIPITRAREKLGYLPRIDYATAMTEIEGSLRKS